jgi:hypothetical protein
VGGVVGSLSAVVSRKRVFGVHCDCVELCLLAVTNKGVPLLHLFDLVVPVEGGNLRRDCSDCPLWDMGL